MDTSTPMGPRRETNLIPPMDTSPIEMGQNGYKDDTFEDSVEAAGNGLRTGILDDTGLLEITPVSPETSSTTEKRLAKGGKDLTKAAEFAGIIRRSKSLPEISCELHENTFYTFCKDRPGGILTIVRSRSVGHLLPEDEDFLTKNSLSPWSSSGGRAVDLIEDKLASININAEAGKEEIGPARTGGGRVSIGKGVSRSLLEEMVTPGGMGEKRYLKFSPDTPRGRFDKVSILESDSPPVDKDGMEDLLVGGKVVKKILRGRRLFQYSPKQPRTSPGVGERKKKKIPLLEKRKVKTKLASRLNTPPAGQPLITMAFGRKEQWTDNRGRGGKIAPIGASVQCGQVGREAGQGGELGGTAPFGGEGLHGPVEEGRDAPFGGCGLLEPAGWDSERDVGERGSVVEEEKDVINTEEKFCRDGRPA